MSGTFDHVQVHKSTECWCGLGVFMNNVNKIKGGNEKCRCRIEPNKAGFAGM